MFDHPRALSSLLVSGYLILGGGEWFYLASRPDLGPLFGKEAASLRLQDRGLPATAVRRLAGGFSGGLGARLGAALLVVSGIALAASAVLGKTDAWSWLPLSALVVLLAFNTAAGTGLEGADQMAVLVLFALGVAAIFPPAETVLRVFMTIQLALAYGVSGLAKLGSPVWRSGAALPIILSSRSFGVGGALSLDRHPWLARIGCWTIICFELMWLTLPFLGAPARIVLLSTGIAFHAVNSGFLGLNLFTWAFVSAYPWIVRITSLDWTRIAPRRL